MKSFLSRLQRVLAPKWVGRLLIAIAFLAGLGLGGVLTGMHFGLLQTRATPPLDEVAAATVDESTIVEDDATDITGAPVVATSDDDEEDADDSEIADADDYEIPDSLKADMSQDPLVASLLGSVSGVDSLLTPESGIRALPTVTEYDHEAVLTDAQSRVSEDFHVPELLHDRVGFWLDVYSKYDSNHRIIHNAMFPWIVYKVVDVTYIINADQPSHLWMRRAKADRLVKQEALRIRATLSRLAHRRNFDKLSDDEKALQTALAPLGGDLRRQSMLALHSVRVQTGQRDFFMTGLQISSRFLGGMEKIFKAHKMPIELTRIPLVESSFNKSATSKVGAAGIWQFMNGTGRKYMMVDGAIDERRSPFKASEAAARLLKENHLILYHSWPLAVTAWNHGPTGMRKAIAKAGSKDLGKIIQRFRSRSFDFASSNFYSEFLGALYAERYSKELFGEIQRDPYVELEVVKLARSVRFSELVKVSGMSRDEFLNLNPELSNVAKKNMFLPRGFRLHVPESALENLQSLFAVYHERPSLMMPKTTT